MLTILTVRAVENKMSQYLTPLGFPALPRKENVLALPYDKPLIGRDCFVKMVANWPRSLRPFHEPRQKLGQQCIIEYANLKVYIRTDRKISDIQ